MPISLLMSAVTARYLGAEALGFMYIGTTFNAFAFLGIDWGHNGALPGLIATDRSRAAALLGTSLLWRAGAGVIAFGVLHVLLSALGYTGAVREAVILLFVAYALGSIVNACQSTTIGLERTDIAAIRQVFEQFSYALFVIPVLVLGGGLRGSLIADILSIIPVLAYVCWAVRATGVPAPTVSMEAAKTLFHSGTPFLFFGLAMVLQPIIDAIFLSKLSPENVVGWYSAARKLIGLLIFPIGALTGALYPTLCRLRATDIAQFKKASSDAVALSCVLAAPVALGCALYPELGISVYSRTSFKPAETNLRLMSIFLFLLYFSIPLGICIMAWGRQRVWALAQTVCVAVSVGLDPLLVPWFQRRMGNGGLGICASTIVSEVVMVAAALVLVPEGILDRRLARTLAFAVLAGTAMALSARLLTFLTPWLAAPITLLVYFVVLWTTGGVDKNIQTQVRGFISRKLQRFA